VNRFYGSNYTGKLEECWGGTYLATTGSQHENSG
jgi:hypothetical protein